MKIIRLSVAMQEQLYMHQAGQACKDHCFTGCDRILGICAKENQYYLLIGKTLDYFSKCISTPLNPVQKGKLAFIVGLNLKT